MNATEYRELYTQAIVPAFPQIVRELFDGVSDEEANARRDLWIKTLSDVDLVDAVNVVEAMASGVLEKPRSWGDLPTAIRVEARERRDKLAAAKRKAEEKAKWRDEQPELQRTWSSLTQYKRRVYRMQHPEVTANWGDIWGQRGEASAMCEEERELIEGFATPAMLKRA